MNNIIFDELKALQEIYDNLYYEENLIDLKVSGTFQADIKLSEIEEVFIKIGDESFKISHFPDLILNFCISEKDSLKLTYDIDCVWLSLTFKNKILMELKRLEEDFEGVLWRWFQFLEMKCIQFIFGMTSQGIVEIHANYMSNGDFIGNDKLYNFFYEYDTDKKKSVFNTSIFECGSCLQQKRGLNCIRLRNCHDIFCEECASKYFNTQIQNSDLELRCLICNGHVDYDEIKGVLNQQAFDRWDQLVLKQYLKSSGTAKTCPRCETMSPVEDNCGLCPKCTFAFCPKCNEAYHSGFDCDQDCNCPICDTTCKVTMSKGICRRCLYEFCSKCEHLYHPGVTCDQREKVRKLNLKQTELLLKKNVKLCPKCKEGYEKIGGCNKMVCPTCRVFFCYLCEKILDRAYPYHHFGVLPQCPLT